MNDYVDPFAAVVGKYSEQTQIVVIIEPDSLPNLATNQGDPHCGNSATTAAYTIGIPYAVNQLAKLAPKASIYVDAAHGGWLGWDDNLQKFVTAFRQLNIHDKVRGFATNVANYQPIGTLCPWSGSGTRNDYCLNGQHQSDACCADPCRLEGQWNDANNELNYAQALSKSMSAGISGFTPYFVIDTGRNGVGDMRKDCANWCNPRGAGAGAKPAASPAGVPDYIDAFYWLKTPGESDGCTQVLPDGSNCPRFDSFCGSSDSIGSQSEEPRAPEAGRWFDYQVKMLASNAHF
jgi:cellulose 1,4-beta-cellobiosidase